MKNIIHETSIIGKGTKVEYGSVISENVVIGKNCFIGYNVVIRPNVVIGDNTDIRSFIFLAEGVTIGNRVKIIQFTNIAKRSRIEDDVFIGPGVILLDTNRISHRRNYSPIGEPPIIRRGARIGGRVTILPGVVIGENCLIGANSLVTKSTIPGWVYFGNPAKQIKPVPEDEIIKEE